MTDPRILSIISSIFAMMAAYSLYKGLRLLRDARRAGRPQSWHKQLSLLTGIEYALLAFVFLLRMASEEGDIAPGMQGLVGWLYLILLLPAILVAGLVIRQAILNMRANSLARQSAASVSASAIQETHAPTRQQRTEHLQRQRERRKKAAAARRRQAGKA